MRRLNYIIVRLIQLIPVTIGVTLVLFLIMRAIPGDPAAIRLGIRATPEALAALRTHMGLDQPLWTQYFFFLRDVFTLNLGNSFMYDSPVMELMAASPGIRNAR